MSVKTADNIECWLLMVLDCKQLSISSLNSFLTFHEDVTLISSSVVYIFRCLVP